MTVYSCAPLSPAGSGFAYGGVPLASERQARFPFFISLYQKYCDGACGERDIPAEITNGTP